MLCTLNLHSDVCQLFLHKTGGKKVLKDVALLEPTMKMREYWEWYQLEAQVGDP